MSPASRPQRRPPGPRRSASGTAVALAIVQVRWRQLYRDPVGLIFTLVAPLAVAVVMGAIYTAEASGPGTVGVLADRSDPVVDEVVVRLEANPLLDVRSYPDREALDDAVRHREVDGGVVVPADLGATSEGGTVDGGTIELVGPPGIAAPSGLRAAVEASTAEAAAAVQLGAVLAPEDPRGAGLTAAHGRLADAAPAPGVSEGRADLRRDFAGYAVMATLVLFVFMNTAAGASGWVEARELGILGRLRSTSARSGALAWGFGVGSASYAAVQAVIVVAIGVVLFDVPLRSPAAVVAVLAATAVAAGGLAVLVATVLPSSASGTTVAGPIAFVLAMLGGCLWPLDIVPGWLAGAGRATPHLWAVEGLQRTAVEGAGLAAVAGSVAVLAAVGLVLGGAGGRRMARAAGGV